MQAYTGFADVYDTFMDNVPYDEWAEYLAELLEEYGVTEGLVLELGCGTGSITRRLAKKGYDMIGIDNSEEMLEIARQKEYESEEYDEEDEYDEEADMADDETVFDEEFDAAEAEGEGMLPGILYLEQDMREFELFGTVAAVVSICDSMNYITSEDDLKKVFKLVNNYLDPSGLFIFDMNTVHKYRDVMGDTVIAENREDCSFIWENYYHEEEMINQYDVTIYKKADYESEDGEPDLYERFKETHYQKAYELETVKRLLQEAGMEFVTAYEVCSKKAPDADTERMYIVAREKKQENKLYV
ncbi:MAG: class I SAM-dependent methyltransferase [Lachnospiraceae bacterium]|nr:class I SAM-dependent methyltransferase [Lachnospiraceae bacterium]